MKDFCHHCGKELEGNETHCPECGAPIGDNPPRSFEAHEAVDKIPIPAILIGLLAIVALVVFMGPGLQIAFGTAYDTTITVEEISIDDEFSGLYSEDGYYLTFLNVSIGDETKDLPEGKNYLYISTDGTKLVPKDGNTVTFKNTGENPNVKVYMNVYVPGITEGENNKDGDLIDVFAVDKEKIEGDVEVFGVTGIVFSKADIDEDGYILLDGDTQPIGHVKVKMTIEKKGLKLF